MTGKPIVHTIHLTPEMQASIQANVAAARVRADKHHRDWQDYRRGLITDQEWREEFGGAVPIDEDDVGLIAECEWGLLYLTDCCGASAKGVEDGVACRNCYQLIDPRLGGIPRSDGPTFTTLRLR